MKPPDPEALSKLSKNKYPAMRRAILLAKKKLKRTFEELRAAQNHKPANDKAKKRNDNRKKSAKALIRYDLHAADVILSQPYYQELYKQEWNLYDGGPDGMKRRFKAVQSFIEVLLSYPDLKIRHPL